ncbi:MAG: SMC-Scp complex subunit ScpB [Rubrobacteraceae bacterium]
MNVNGPEPGAAMLVEAILLVSPQPISLEILSSATGLDATEIETATVSLGEKYSKEASGIVLRNVAGGYQLATNPACAAAVERFREESRPAPLSNAANEVLSCALYLGPLTRAGISGVRGVNSDAVVRNLLERGLLSEVGVDNESPGSPALINVTAEFYAAAGAVSQQDFPPLDSLVGEDELTRVRERLGAAGENPVPNLTDD